MMNITPNIFNPEQYPYNRIKQSHLYSIHKASLKAKYNPVQINSQHEQYFFVFRDNMVFSFLCTIVVAFIFISYIKKHNNYSGHFISEINVLKFYNIDILLLESKYLFLKNREKVEYYLM